MDRKNQVVRFRCTSDQRKLVEDLARNDGLTLSEFLLRLVDEEAHRRRKSVMSPDEIAAEYGSDGGHTTTAPHGDQ